MENIENNNPEVTANEYWRSLDEKYKTPEFLKTLDNEFMSSPLREEDGKDGLARRQFMKLMGASVALSAAACVRRPVEKIIPYNKRPGEIIPDIANYYASTWFDGSEGLGLIVKTREGRPLHVAGSPEHPLNGSGLSARASAHILSLYDPDRLTSPYMNSVDPKKRRNSLSVKRTFDQIDPKVAEQLKKGSVAILTSSLPSPHTQSLMSSFLSRFGGKKYVWDVMSTETHRLGQELSYGTDIVPNYHFDKAQLVVSLDADFLGTYITPVKFTKDFQSSRDPQKAMSRLISFQSVASLTSLNADDNYPVRASRQLNVALGLLQRVVAKKGGTLPEKARKAINDESLGLAAGTLDKVAKDLLAHAGQGIVIAGGLAADTQSGVALQVAVNWLNTALGNEGKTITGQGAVQGLEGKASDILSLINDLNDKKIKTLIVHNVNPIYSLPASLKLEEALNNLEMMISTSNWMDETAKLADVVAISGHPMENWNEYEYVAGVRTIQQPTISPLHGSRSFEDSLMAWSKAAGKEIATEATFAEYLKNKTVAAVGSEKGWFEYLQKGFRGTPSAAGGARSWNSKAIGMIEAVLGNLIGEASASQEATSGTELVLYPTVHMTDGTLANVSWLLELPDPVSKITWENALTVSAADAKAWGIKDGSVMEVKVGEASVKAPAFIQPGQAAGVVGLAIGYGRKSGGELQKNVGVNASQLAQVSKDNRSLIYSGITADVQKTGEWSELAITQGHNSMEGRQIVAETSLKNFKHGDNGIHRHKIFSIWGEHKYDGHKWALGIDLNSCTGCSACVISCQSENNIPVVGKKYVIQGREMHWIRIDRYYKGDESNPDAVFQPVMCQHCENAPCETVCPVVATVHSDEGLNDMVYNRCVGTRYCSNNCPYKVRRFNWFKWESHTKQPLHMALNPDVTVRVRGVMEKCTFCVQRIKESKNTARDEERDLKDGDIKTACQEVCPTGALVFGDLNDKKSAVAKMFQDQRQYILLEETNSAPRVRYLAKIRNTDREMGGHHAPAGGHDEHKADDKHGAGHKQEHGALETQSHNGGAV